MSRTKFRVDLFALDIPYCMTEFEKWLDNLAVESWELIAVFPYRQDAMLVIHKRRKRWWQ